MDIRCNRACDDAAADDADATGAVYGQIAGAFYGEASIPSDWRGRLGMRDSIRELADGACVLATS